MHVRIAITLVAVLSATSPASVLAQASTYGVPVYDGSTIPYGTPIYGESVIPQGSVVIQDRASATARANGRQTFEEKFWQYLTENNYRQWAPVPGKTGDAYEGQSPHGEMLKMYLNRRAAGRPHELPDGSIIVKENFSADGETLTAITVMYRSTGYHGDAGDWYWVRYQPDGKVEHTLTDAGTMKLAGKVNGCIDCHAAAEGGDFAFFNDGSVPGSNHR